MFDYLWIFLWLAIVGFITPQIRCRRCEEIPGSAEKSMRISPAMAFIIILPMVLWAGMRDYWFGDTGAYYAQFLGYPDTPAGFFEYLSAIPKDPGFYGISALIKLLVGDARTYFVAVALFQGICLLKFFRRYSDDYITSLFLFVASTDILSWMFNGMRQFVAVCVTLLGLSLYVKKRYIPAILLILAASLFHQSALLLLPFIFVAQGKAWNKKTLAFLLAVIIAVVFVDQFTNILDTSLQGTQYENVVGDYTSWNDDGTNPIRVIVYSIPAVLAFIGRKKIESEGGPLINFCANMSIVSAGFYLISMVTSGIFIGRLPIYFSLYGYILLPWEIDNMFAENSKKLVKYVMLACYLGFYYYQVFMTW